MLKIFPLFLIKEYLVQADVKRKDDVDLPWWTSGLDVHYLIVSEYTKGFVN